MCVKNVLSWRGGGGGCRIEVSENRMLRKIFYYTWEKVREEYRKVCIIRGFVMVKLSTYLEIYGYLEGKRRKLKQNKKLWKIWRQETTWERSSYECKASVKVYKKCVVYGDMQWSQLAQVRKSKYDYVNENSVSKKRENFWPDEPVLLSPHGCCSIQLDNWW
jgi:hypothetical protein